MKVSVLGCGTVGKGVCDMIESVPGLELGPVLVLPSERSESFMVTDIDVILNDSTVGAVVETIGGEKTAGSFAERTLKAGKHFVTSNKALVADRGIELSALARSTGKAFLFSAACGGGIPFLHNLSVARKSDDILSMSGILNGTTNYVLDMMQSEGVPLDTALSQARRLGYAEADPSADISGLDSYRKIILACAVAYGIQPDGYKDIEGIAGFTRQDADIISRRGAAVRLIASGGLNGDGSVYAFVEPRVFFSGMERAVRKNFNSVSYTGRNAGLITYSGQGAGRYPTASAVLRDITGIEEGALYMLPAECVKRAAVNDMEEKYLVRCDVSMKDSFVTEEVWSEEGGTAVFVTGPMAVSRMHSLAAELRNSGHGIFFASLGE